MVQRYECIPDSWNGVDAVSTQDGQFVLWVDFERYVGTILKDIVDAAGDLEIETPEPGTDMAKVLLQYNMVSAECEMHKNLAETHCQQREDDLLLQEQIKLQAEQIECLKQEVVDHIHAGAEADLLIKQLQGNIATTETHRQSVRQQLQAEKERVLRMLAAMERSANDLKAAAEKFRNDSREII